MHRLNPIRLFRRLFRRRVRELEQRVEMLEYEAINLKRENSLLGTSIRAAERRLAKLSVSLNIPFDDA